MVRGVAGELISCSIPSVFWLFPRPSCFALLSSSSSPTSSSRHPPTASPLVNGIVIIIAYFALNATSHTSSASPGLPASVGLLRLLHRIPPPASIASLGLLHRIPPPASLALLGLLHCIPSSSACLLSLQHWQMRSTKGNRQTNQGFEL